MAERELWRLLEHARAREAQLDIAEVALTSVEPSPFELAASRAGIAPLLAPLKRQQRTVLVGRALGLSYKQLAACTGHTVTWVNRHAKEGRTALRCLAERDHDDAVEPRPAGRAARRDACAP